ncbi:MAG: helix-turn-helix domain-containing protein, partial [Candidatus Accumulibacter phosphatis]|nr:helix-turn-helix domain-containing protein [Candidatus Accumulibacter phosphatis]
MPDWFLDSPRPARRARICRFVLFCALLVSISLSAPFICQKLNDAMHLTLEQAAALLGKTRRQVVYMIEQGRLPAQKVGGRWVIERAALTTDEPVGWAEARSPTIQGDRLGC